MPILEKGKKSSQMIITDEIEEEKEDKFANTVMKNEC